MFLKLKVIFYSIFFVFISYNVYLSSFFVRNNEVHFINDIGRDFLLLQELDLKKIVLIGARSNAPGVFHGPLWTYLNYPAYLIGNGNPVVVGWFWVLLGVIFLITTFFMFKKILNGLSALLGTTLLSVILISQSNRVFGQEAAFYFMPFFLFTIYMYITSRKIYFLALHLIAVGIFIQFNIGVGSLFAMLSFFLILVFIIKNRLWKHIVSFLVIPLTLSNFLLFDLRHQFGITKSLLKIGSSSKFLIPFSQWIQNRFDHLTSLQITTTEGHTFPIILFLSIVFFSILEIKNNSRQKKIIVLLAFYYFGYMALSYFNKGIMLIDYVFLLIPLSVFWLSALACGKFRIIFIPIFLIIINLNVSNANEYLSFAKSTFMGKSPDSWISLTSVAKYVIKEQAGKEFGYFVYSPDAYAYQQRYGMIYWFKSTKAKDFEYVKKTITYIIASPPPVSRPFMREDWWIKNEARISDLPVEKKYFDSGYIVERFNLSAAEQKVSHDSNIELGLHFR